MRAHYRSALNYSDVHLDDARGALKRLYTALELVAPAQVAIDWSDPYASRFKAAMDNDFATPEAVAVLFELAAEVNRGKSPQVAGLLKALGGCLGILQGDPEAVPAGGNAAGREHHRRPDRAARRRQEGAATSPRPTASATNCWPRAWC